MVNEQTLQGNWNEIKGKLKSKWGQLTNDDVQSFSGSLDQLVGLIQRKTGETRSSVETYLEELTSNGASSFSQAAETARQYAQQATEKAREYAGSATETLQHRSRQAADSLRYGYEEAEHLVRDRPAESMAVCFGTGVFVGVLLGMVLRSR
jgi:uncharacterized protein YjbJ (UPF0337 family)